MILKPSIHWKWTSSSKFASGVTHMCVRSGAYFERSKDFFALAHFGYQYFIRKYITEQYFIRFFPLLALQLASIHFQLVRVFLIIQFKLNCEK